MGGKKMGNGKVAALIPAAGSGTRLGLGAKAFVEVGGLSLLARSIHALRDMVDEVVIALPPEWKGKAWNTAGISLDGVEIVWGGTSRQESVYRLLEATDAEWVLIHDAARPFLPPTALVALLAEMKACGAATLALPVADTLVRAESVGVKSNEWQEPVSRENLWQIQTPQAFRRSWLVEAHRKAAAEGFLGTDDAGLVARLGHTVKLVRGDARLMKITTPADLPLAELLAEEQGQPTFPQTVFSPAKINLGLSVLGKRTDGYHELHSIFSSLSIGDRLTFERTPWFSLEIRGALLSDGEDNLVYRAAHAYWDAAQIPPEDRGFSITLHKHLPLASGLGGGSSNAAVTLIALERFHRAGVHLPELARRLGADVPFFLKRGGALVTGIGEKIMPLHLPPRWVVLANAGAAVSARDAYTWLETCTPPLPLEQLLQALWDGEKPPYFNALQAGVAARIPSIGQTLTALEEAGLHGALMSGSGATCFALADSREAAARAAEALGAAHPDWWVAAAQLGVDDVSSGKITLSH